MSNFEDYDLRSGGANRGRTTGSTNRTNTSYAGRQNPNYDRRSASSMDLDDEIDFYEYDGDLTERPRKRPSQSASHSASHPGTRRPSSSSRSGGSRSASRPTNRTNAKSSRPSASRPTGKKTSGKKGGKKKKNKKAGIIAVEIVLILVLLIGFFVWNKFSKLDIRDGLKYGDNGNVEANDLDEATEEVLSNYITIALFGVDNRSNGDYDGGNSDTIMIAAINKDTKEVKMVSVQRDTYLQISDDTYRKCNYAYNHGGPEEAISMLNTNLDLKIDGYVAVDFYALATVVDDLGGIEVNVSQSMIDAVNDKTGQPALAGYIAEVEEVIYGEGSWKERNDCYLSAGTQTLNGAQVVGYCRNRFSGDNDFARAERQRDVIKKIIEKAKKADVAKLNKITDDVFPSISTSLSLTEMLSMAASVGDYEIVESSGFPFDLTTGTYGKKGSLVVPCTLTSNVVKLHEFLYDQKDYDPTDDKVDAISQKIQNDTGTSESSANKTQTSDGN